MTEDLVQAIVLAAGKATRFKTNSTKLIEPICGQEMIVYTTELFARLHIPITMVVGHHKELVQQAAQKVTTASLQFITQEEQKGTGHALLCTKDAWYAAHILIINGDMPLVTTDIIQALIKKHVETDAAISFVISYAPEHDHSYGRVIKSNNALAIVEAKNFTGDPFENHPINAGIYIIKKEFLESSIYDIQANEKTKEFYITDLIKIASDKEAPIQTITVPYDRIRGINTLYELWNAQQIKQQEIIRFWIEHGVHFYDPHSVFIDVDVQIGTGTTIGAGVHLLQASKIGSNSHIYEYCSIKNSTIGDNCTIYPHTIIHNSFVGNGVQVGPFAHIKEESSIHDKAVIGNFVEVKKTVIGAQTKAKHLSYLGNSTIGRHVNIGAGTITCNHTGSTKENTYIQDDVYIGSNSTLVAPITIGQGAFTAAGSVITENVPDNALAFGRARQVIKEGYAPRLRRKQNSFLFYAATKTTNDNSSNEQL